MKWIHCCVIWFCIIVAAPAGAIVGDLNLDSRVDLDDFFILSDNFGKTGEPDFPDTIRITLTDTLYLQGPVPSAAPGQNSPGLIDGYWDLDVQHGVLTVDLGPGHEIQRRRIMRVINTDSSRIWMRWYWKPSGHLLQEEVYTYTTIMLAENIFGFYGDYNADRGLSTRYYYDADMNISSSLKKNARDIRAWDSDEIFIDLGISDLASWAEPYEGGEGYLGFLPIDKSDAYIFARGNRSDVENWTFGYEQFRWSKNGIDWEAELAK